ncbi:MAG: NAD(P)/FAD-dependent oxidoreductase [Verrucomicrobiales bacterium]
MASQKKPITIIGGGLAGLTLGILLRRQGVKVTVIEAGKYPRHRVCGEFISGRGSSILWDLGVLHGKDFHHHIDQARFFSETRLIGNWQLPEPALGISRFDLDALLAETFRREGGTLLEQRRMQPNEVEGEGVVWANGRQISLNKDDWRYIGIKAHAQLPISLDHLEVHFSANGYIGVSPLPGGLANVCGLFRFRNTVNDLKKDWPALLRGPAGSPLHNLLGSARFNEESFSSVAGLSFRPQVFDSSVAKLGDSLGMIAPLTGNGMSIAFETAALATNPLLRFCEGNCPWSETLDQLQNTWESAFIKRLRVARLLQSVMLGQRGRILFFLIFESFPALFRMAYRLTHS